MPHVAHLSKFRSILLLFSVLSLIFSPQSRAAEHQTGLANNPKRPPVHTLPTLESRTPIAQVANASTGVYNSSTNPPLIFRGGGQGIGVTLGSPKVYLVFWGSQWGSQGVTSDGYMTLSGDRNGVAPYLQRFFAGIGTNNESWSSVLTQYCVASQIDATSCKPTDPHIEYPSSKVLAGVWYDSSAAAPASATYTEIAKQAELAASYFGNINFASNASAQYFIISPSGTKPDNFNSPLNWCAWHSYSSSNGGIAFTNLPYLPDVGTSCGAGFVNSGNILDGVSIVAGHEYQETLTDRKPYVGWIDSLYYENADICAWIRDPRASGNINLSTGVFAVQGSYSNDTGSCEMTHANVLTSTLKLTTTSIPNTTIGANYFSQLIATGGVQPYIWTATNLPPGLVLSSDGKISGSATVSGNYVVNFSVTDSAADPATLSKSLNLNVFAPPLISMSSLPAATYGSGYSAAISTTGGNTPLTFSATGLPSGLQINAQSGLISGIPTITGSFNTSLLVTDSSGISNSKNFILTVNSAPALVSTFSTPVSNSIGFTSSITNYDINYQYSWSTNLGNLTLGTLNGSTLPFTISGLSSGQSATVKVTTDRIGYLSGSNSLTGTALTILPGLTSNFSTPISTSTGFTVFITNYNSAYTYAISVSTGKITRGTASGSNLPLTITGLSAGASATVSVTTSRSGYSSVTSNVTGSAIVPQSALIPILSIPVSVKGGFTFTVNNYDSSFTFTATTTSGKISAGTILGSTRTYTVSGLKIGQSATATIKTSKSGYLSGSASVTGKSL